MSTLAAWPVLLPLITAIILLFVAKGDLRLARIINLLSVLGVTALALVLIGVASDDVHRVYALGNWVPPFGIVLVLDRLSALMVGLTMLLALASLGYAIATDVDTHGPHFHVLFQFQLFGLNGAFLTGDVFNLFVFFEVLLLASYGLLLHGGGRLRTKAGLHYVVINLVGSTLFLFAVGAMYGVLGSLNLADMAQRVAASPAENHSLIAAASLLLLVVFGIKAAAFPLYLWLPAAYAETSAPIAALFAIMTKVGLYAIVRVHGTLFGSEAGELAGLITPWLAVAGWITLGLAALGVLAATRLQVQIAYLVLASIGTLLIGFGLATPQAYVGALYYLIHSTLLAAAFFLLADLIVRARGEDGDRLEPGAAMPNGVLLGALFFGLAIALAGIPPLSGFFGKLLILHAALYDPRMAIHYALILLSSFVIIVALAKSGSTLFYQTQAEAPSTGLPPQKAALPAVLGLLLAAPLMVVFARPLTTWLEATALQLHDTRGYVNAVLTTPAVQNTP
ncbi:MAG: monovalent cation/H+ antiporter subunit D [Gammaproteobacteria bacterium]|nr:monovalent cation/H+ antiporter subunit D [Gammaproteobacteria bacterium]